MKTRSRTLIHSPGLLVLALVLIFTTHLSLTAQQVRKVGTSSAKFLRIPVGAKSIAMGGAFTAIADDGSAMFWNPGNTAVQSGYTLFIHHSPWLPGLDHNYAGFLLPVSGVGVFGINVVSLMSEEMEITTMEAPMGTGETFTAASTAAGFTFARNLTDRFSIGANFKYISERIFHSRAAGFGFDVGTMFITPFRDIRFGVSISNVGTGLQMHGEDLNTYVDVAPNKEGNNENIVARLKTDEFGLPIIMRMGVAWDWQMSAGTRLTIAGEGVNPNDNNHSVSLGAEFATLNEVLMLRGGFSELFLEDREKGLTLGAGIRLPATEGLAFKFDYAYQDFRHLGGVHHVTIQTAFQP